MSSGLFRVFVKFGTFTELRTTSFIECMGVTCSDSVSHNWVQVLSIPVLLLSYFKVKKDPTLKMGKEAVTDPG